MTEINPQQQSQLIGVLREGIGVVQMIIFKELRSCFAEKYKDRDITFRSMLVGAVINELFGQINPEGRFQLFNKENHAAIEQELLGLSEQLASLRPNITDALRVQALCDNQEGGDSSAPLIRAEELGILIKDRDIPLPSTFMIRVRQLGEQHGLTVAPVEVTPEQDNLIH